jgi:hypothetical protein
MGSLVHVSPVETIIIRPLGTFAETAEKNTKTVFNPMDRILFSRMTSLPPFVK